MAIYLFIDGIKGDVVEDSHTDWINCDSMTWGIGRMINTPVGTEAERESSVPTVQDVVMTTQMDKATPEIVKAAATGTGKEAKIHLMQTGKDTPECYMEYILSNTLISDYSVSVAADGRPSESFALNFTKIEMKYTMFDKDNNVSGNVPASYDLTTGQPG